jgi:hypothetical protein
LSPKSADAYFESQGSVLEKEKQKKQQNNLDGRFHDLLGLIKALDNFPCQEHFMAWIIENSTTIKFSQLNVKIF